MTISLAIGTLALCYNNIEVFRGVVKMRCGLTAKIIERTKSMADIYGAFFYFSCMLKSKVDDNDPNAQKTNSRIETILKLCRESGTLSKRKSYIMQTASAYNTSMIVFILVILAILLAYLLAANGHNDVIGLYRILICD
ncbi:hypothetical protein M9H77_13569 [Catharanthus roseus]|uniref:Uncharacterized protein n=1 Tax=Catharanthus roseus TaxID=4058 RepID=A0ACC0BKG9_CATRO|nr:hypothetical protein M9H77_13569 [Catharanthus roseus]